MILVVVKLVTESDLNDWDFKSPIDKPVTFPRQTLTTTPAVVHVVSLFVPLEPHTEAVLDEGGHQTEATESGQNELRVSQKVLRHILCLRD